MDLRYKIEMKILVLIKNISGIYRDSQIVLIDQLYWKHQCSGYWSSTVCVYKHLCDNTFFEFTSTSIRIKSFFQSRCSETLCVLWEALPWRNGYPDLPTSSNEGLFYGRHDKMIQTYFLVLFIFDSKWKIFKTCFVGVSFCLSFPHFHVRSLTLSRSIGSTY